MVIHFFVLNVFFLYNWLELMRYSSCSIKVLLLIVIEMLDLHSIVLRASIREHLPCDVLKVFKGYHYCGDVVKGPLESRLVKDSVDRVTTLLMNTSVIVFICILMIVGVSGCLPHSADNVLVIKLLENSITTNDDEVIVVSNLKASDVRSRYHNLHVTSVMRIFSFDISDSS